MNEHFILVNCDQQGKLEQAVMDFCNLYADAKSSEWIRLFRRKGEPNSFLISFTNQPDFDLFSFCVNYLKYPSDLPELKAHVVGFFNTDLDSSHHKKSSGWVKVFIPKNDTEFDNVYFVNNQNQVFINDFGSGIKRLHEAGGDYELIQISLEAYHHISDYVPNKSAKGFIVDTNKPWWKFW